MLNSHQKGTTKPLKGDLFTFLKLKKFADIKSYIMFKIKPIKICLLLITFSLLVSCLQDSSLNKMELESAVLNQCDYIHAILRNKYQYYSEDREYVNSCGCVSTIVTDELLEIKSEQQIKQLMKDSAKIIKAIEYVMYKKSKEIKASCISGSF